MKHRSVITIFLIVLMAIATGCSRQKAESTSGAMTRDQLIEANKRKVTREKDLIDRYIELNGLSMKATSTGLRYEVYKAGWGDSARTGDLVSIAYTALLMDSTKVGSATPADPLIFRVGQADVVTGLHEAVALMREGDNARLILPSYLAYGLTGLSPDIPPNATLLYDLQLLEVY